MRSENPSAMRQFLLCSTSSPLPSINSFPFLTSFLPQQMQMIRAENVERQGEGRPPLPCCPLPAAETFSEWNLYWGTWGMEVELGRVFIGCRQSRHPRWTPPSKTNREDCQRAISCHDSHNFLWEAYDRGWKQRSNRSERKKIWVDTRIAAATRCVLSSG